MMGQRSRTSVLFSCLVGLVIIVVASLATYAQDSVPDKLAEFLYHGDLVQGEKYLETRLASDSKEEVSRAALGIVQFMSAIEGLAQDYYRFGLAPQRNAVLSMGGLNLPKTFNPQPDEIDYLAARGIFERLQERLSKAEKTLSTFNPVGIKLPLDVSRLELDLDSDGTKANNIPVGMVVSLGRNRQNAVQQNAMPSVTIAFDDADIYWLRGYIHVVLGTTDIVLAHDWRDAFERVGHFFFPRPKTPYSYLLEEGKTNNGWSYNEILDLIAMIHVVNFEVSSPEKMQSAFRHFEEVIALSRITWKQIRLETDNDREWLPGPNQNSVVLPGRMGGTLGENWERVLDRSESVLQGKELLPFWRGFDQGIGDVRTSTGVSIHPDIGINLRKVFMEPKRFDLVLWIQGTGPGPYLEKGKIIDFQAWRDLSNSFDGNLPFFSFWIN